MSSGLPELILTVRPVCVFDSAGDPWSGTRFSPEDAIETMLELATEIFAKAGIIIKIHRDGIVSVSVDHDDSFEFDDHSLAEAEWQLGQTWIDVFFVRDMSGASGVALGPYEGDALASAAVIAALPNATSTEDLDRRGLIVAQELGHLLGLPHVTGSHEWDADDPDEFIERCFWPFSDDTAGMSVAGRAQNPMSYYAGYYWYNFGEPHGEFGWTPNQIKRLRLTLTSRRSRWMRLLYGLFNFPGSSFEDAYARFDSNSIPDRILPDYANELRAAVLLG